MKLKKRKEIYEVLPFLFKSFHVLKYLHDSSLLIVIIYY